MSKRLAKLLALVLSVALLLSVPGLVGCGGEGEVSATNKIKIGWLWDFTGRASLGVTQMYQGLVDYLRMTAEENPVPGAEIEMLTFDTKSDAARVPEGYVWLKGRGAVMLSAAPQDTELLKPRAVADNLPFYSTSTMQAMIAEGDWLVNMYGSPDAQLDIITQYIKDNWPSYPTKPKIGIVSLIGIPFYTAQRDYLEKVMAANPDKFEYVGAQMAPTTTTVWAVEINKLKACDYIIVVLSGSPLASFITESRQRGYTGEFVGLQEGLIGYWSLIKATVSLQVLDGALCTSYWQWWNDSGSFVDEVKEYVQKYHSAADAEKIMLTSGPFTGWIYGMMLVDSLRRAAAAVGAENVTGDDLFQALKETKMTVQGFKYAWEITPNVNCLLRGVKMMQFSAAQGNFVTISDYVIPSLLAG